jgi:tetratricopeptide (TPR) repeat protein
VQAAADSLSGLRMLHRLTQHWQWPAKEAQVLWSLVRRFPNDNQAWQKLIGLVLASRDTAQVWRTYTAWLQAAPANVPVRIERLVIGLLTRQPDPNLSVHAAEMYRIHPEYPGCRLAQGLALWRAGQFGEALAVLDGGTIKPADEPRLALARGLVLAALGRPAESEQMFALVKPEWLLPEEVALIAAARAGAK